MSHHPYGARHALRVLTGLDFGLRVRIERRSPQRTISSGAPDASVQELCLELAELVSSLRIYSYAMRGHLEQVTQALLLNVEGGSWRYARRAALDLSGLLGQAAKRRLADRGLCVRAANGALRIAELCARAAGSGLDVPVNLTREEV